jgi:pimeloyl-ACP methyl ester carboxylesterase
VSSSSTALLTRGSGLPAKPSQPRRTCAWSPSTVPGLGGRTYSPRRTFGVWPSDVVELADALRVEKFGVVGWLGGEPHAAACAAPIPARFTGVGNVCSRHLSQFNIAENASAGEEPEADDREMLELVQRDPNAAAALRTHTQRGGSVEWRLGGRRPQNAAPQRSREEALSREEVKLSEGLERSTLSSP